MEIRRNKYLRIIYNSWNSFSRKFFSLRKKIEFPFWSMFSRIKYRAAVFLDANMVMLRNSEIDKRVEKLRKSFTRYFITDVIAKEIHDLENSGLIRIFPYKYKVVGFSKLREILPSLCPVYYNLISWMYNPANITSQEFHLHLLQSLKLRGRKLAKSQEKLYMRFMDRLKRGAENNFDASGNPKSLIAKHIDISAFQYFQKKIKNRNSENLLNDYKNISTILLFTLLNKINTVFVTADRDVLAIVFTLAESLAQGGAFPYFFLPTLTDQDKQDLFSGKRITRFIDFDEFKKYNENLLGDILNPYWQKDHISFKIRLWDDKKQCFVEDMVVNFDEVGREMALNMHGPLSCPYAKNDTHGNWLHYQYWPPPLKSHNVVKVLLSVKKVKSRRNIYVPDFIHQQTCKYAIDDKAGRLKDYHGFWL